MQYVANRSGYICLTSEYWILSRTRIIKIYFALYSVKKELDNAVFKRNYYFVNKILARCALQARECGLNYV